MLWRLTRFGLLGFAVYEFYLVWRRAPAGTPVHDLAFAFIFLSLGVLPQLFGRPKDYYDDDDE